MARAVRISTARRWNAFAHERWKTSDLVALEATTNAWPVTQILRPFVAVVVVIHPLKTNVIAEAKIKTDKVDPYVRAHLLRGDYLAEVWQPNEQTQSAHATCRTDDAAGAA